MFSVEFLNTYPMWFMAADGIICVIILIVCARLEIIMDPFYCVLAAFNPITILFVWMLVIAPLVFLGVLFGWAILYGLASWARPSISNGESK